MPGSEGPAEQPDARALVRGFELRVALLSDQGEPRLLVRPLGRIVADEDADLGHGCALAPAALEDLAKEPVDEAPPPEGGQGGDILNDPGARGVLRRAVHDRAGPLPRRGVLLLISAQDLAGLPDPLSQNRTAALRLEVAAQGGYGLAVHFRDDEV